MIRIRKEIGHELPNAEHSFPVPGGPVLKADTIKGLLLAIREYRINNGMPTGDPVEELTAHYAKTYPFAVENGEREDYDLHDDFMEEVMAWVNGYWKSPPKQLLPAEDTIHRQAKCLACPYRTEEAAGDGPAAVETRRRAYLLTKGAPTDETLGCCTYHKWDNRLACLLPNPEIIRVSPECCWCHKDLDKSK